jgi:hypothetical protein
MMRAKPTLAYVIEPRFSGGTSAAVAAELRVAAGLARVAVHAISTRMFKGNDPAPVLADALDDLGLGLTWDSPVIGADLVVLHNPSFLRFQNRLDSRIVCRDLVVVTHENFLRPGDARAFDVLACLEHIRRASLSARKWLAPVSAANRVTVQRWLDGQDGTRGWQMLAEDWFNICDFAAAPSPNRPPPPADRRGRLSRPGPEKFPALADLDLCFPPHAAANVILGADRLIAAGIERRHWAMHPFGSLPVADFFGMIDFMVYFTAPTWRESFGRVLAEAMGAGKVVLTDAATAAPFGDGVLACTPAEVDQVISHYLARPDVYAAQVRRGQARLAAFSGAAFAEQLATLLHGWQERAA